MRTSWAALPDDCRSRSITLKDCLLPARTVCHQMFSSLLQFDVMMNDQNDPVEAHYWYRLFGIR
ncbi:MAG: hypothetical protein OXC62_07650 [Aestuariivita sp.]|nr:hypothetical protein [Aestuariivita sp.]